MKFTGIAQVGDKVRTNYLKEKAGYEETDHEVTQVTKSENGESYSMMLKPLGASTKLGTWGSLPAKFEDGRNYMFDMIKRKQ